MNNKKNKIIIFVLLFMVAILLIRVVFDKRFDDFQKMVQWEKEYKEDNPDATKEEIDQSFKDGMKGLEEWTKEYKIAHPDATDEEIDKAFKDAWGK